MLDYVLLIVGFVLLIKGADFFVDGSASVAKKLRVSDHDYWNDHCRQWGQARRNVR